VRLVWRPSRDGFRTCQSLGRRALAGRHWFLGLWPWAPGFGARAADEFRTDAGNKILKYTLSVQRRHFLRQCTQLTRLSWNETERKHGSGQVKFTFSLLTTNM
jgi:hypothetical protein